MHTFFEYSSEGVLQGWKRDGEQHHVMSRSFPLLGVRPKNELDRLQVCCALSAS